jgi:hypothetical protein
LSEQPSDGDSFAGARANIRDTIKWLIAAFAGVAAVIVGTAPLTDIGSLKGLLLLLALSAGALGIICVLLAINVAVKILVTPIFFLSDIVKDPALSKIIDDHCGDVLPAGFKTVKEFLANRTKIQDTLFKLQNTEPGPNETDDAAAERRKEIQLWQSVLPNSIAVTNRLLGLAHYERLRRGFDESRKALFQYAIFAVLFLTGFSVLTTRAKTHEATPPLHVILDQAK